MEELYLFILWKNSFDKKDEILEDIKNKFEIINMYNVTWSDYKFSENLSRFYGKKLPDGSAKEEHCGRGSFLLIIVKDNNPKFGYRETTAGKEYVNTNMFDSKTMYREWTGGGHKVHCTNSIKETNHDLTLLLDKNVDDYLKDVKKEEHVIELQRDLLGANGFNSVEEMFYALNNCTEYAILRNYEKLPHEIYVNEHNDIDLICKSREETAYVLNAKKAQIEEFRVQYNVKVEGKIANFDLRYVGDNYYDKCLEESLLNNRIFYNKVFYILSNEDYFYTLLYHALIHKLDFSEDYKQRLIGLNKKFTRKIADGYKDSIKFLEKWLVKKGYIATKPNDKTVIYNHNVLEYLKPNMYINNGDIKNCSNINKYIQFIKNVIKR